MLRDIDYAAQAVQRAIVEKFGRQNDLQALQVTAGERTISVRHDQRSAEGTRDNLMSSVRDAKSYADLWQSLPGQESSAG